MGLPSTCPQSTMSKLSKLLALLCATAVCIATPGDESDSNNDWPTTPPPSSSDGRRQSSWQNHNGLMMPFGNFPPITAPPVPQPAMGWPNPYAYTLFGLPAPFGFLQLQAPPMFYGGYGPPMGALVGNAETTPYTGEEVPMMVDTGTNHGPAEDCDSCMGERSHQEVVAGPSHARDSPRLGPRTCTRSEFEREIDHRSRRQSPSPPRAAYDDKYNNRRRRKGKQRAMSHDMEQVRHEEERR